MSVVRYSPVQDVFSLWNRDLNRWLTDSESGQSTQWQPAVDIHETENSYVLLADLPGVASDAIDITLDDSVLTISGQRDVAAEQDEGVTVRRAERRTGAFSRQFSLPEMADVDGIQATGNNGLLSVVIPKRAQSQPRKIAVTH